MSDIITQLQSKANLLTPNTRITPTDLVRYNGDPSHIYSDTFTAQPEEVAGVSALKNMPVTSLYATSLGKYYVKVAKTGNTDGSDWKSLGGSATFDGNELVLEDINAVWRVISTETHFKIDKQYIDPDTLVSSWVNYVDIGDGFYTSGVNIEEGNIQLHFKGNGLGPDQNIDVDEKHNLVGISEHVDGRNTQIGNFFDKTYLNSGTGGIWSVVEQEGTDTIFKSSSEHKRLETEATPVPDKFIITQRLEIPVKGLFSSEIEQLAGVEWNPNVTNDPTDTINFNPKYDPENPYGHLEYNTFNVYGLHLKLNTQVFDDADPATPIAGNVRYRTSILSEEYLIALQQSQSNDDFKSGLSRVGYTYPAELDDTVVTDTLINLPKKRYTLNNISPRILVIEFDSPTKVYGWYPNPADPLNPTDDEFEPYLAMDVVFTKEERILTESAIDEKLDEIIGSQEWQYAIDNELNTLHIDPDGRQVLATASGDWILFWADDGGLPSDEHQYMTSTGREAIYIPNSSGNFSDPLIVTDNYVEANPLVVHLVEPAKVRNFGVSLMIDDAFEAANRATYDGVRFTFYIHTHGLANSHSVSVSIPWDYSMQYMYTTDRNGQYTYRAHIFNDNLAALTQDGVDESTFPSDPNNP